MNIKSVILVLIAVCYGATAWAEPAVDSAKQDNPLAWYEIEVIAFEPVDPPQTNEKWPVVIEASSPTEVIELASPEQSSRRSGTSRKTEAFRLLDPDEHQLDGIASNLEAGNRHNILLHVAWRQPLEENAQGMPVHIHSGLMEHFLTEKERHARQQAAAANETIILNDLPDQEATLNEPGSVEHFVDGTLQLRLTRYLHLNTHVIYFNPDVDRASRIADQEFDTPIVERFLLKESRRVRRKELHYFDHPYFGIIARVTRYEEAKGNN